MAAPMSFKFRLEDHGVTNMLRIVHTNTPHVISRALNKTAFEVRDAEVAMTRLAFDYWSSVTKSFMANKRSFPFELAKPNKLQAKVFGGTQGASKRSSKMKEIFWSQEFGFTLKPNERERLALGSSPTSYAVPTKSASAHLRTPRATVRRTQTPGALLQNTAKQGGGFSRFRQRRRSKKGIGNLGVAVFVSPNDKAILEVTPSGERRVLYGLYQRNIDVKPHLQFFATAEKAINQHITMKILTEWDKSFGRF